MLSVTDLKKYFWQGFWRRSFVRAVDGVSFTLRKGQTLGLVGESGSGKTTIGRLVVGLLRPTGGSVLFEGINIFGVSRRESLHLRRKMQIIFQDPEGALNPRMRIGELLAEPLKVHRLVQGRYIKERVADLLAMVGLETGFYHRYPCELSGGQNQRVVIARALSLEPDLLVLDEPTSALDVSVQAQILQLLREVQKQMNLACLFISHDLDVVRQMAGQIAVVYRGQIVEQARAAALFNGVRHPYTKSLLSARLAIK
ncbi:MAG: ATP-binding cassette domain-containing protein [Bacillota bacterium]